MTEIFTAKLERAPLTIEEIASWMSTNKKKDSHRPLSRESRDLFAFSMHGVDGFVGWNGSSDTRRDFAVDVELDDFMFFFEHASYCQLATGNIRHVVTPDCGVLTTADRYSRMEIGEQSIGEGFVISRKSVMTALTNTFECFVPVDFEFSPMQLTSSGAGMQIVTLMRFFRDEICANHNVRASPIAIASFQETLSLLMVQNLSHSLSHRQSSGSAIAPKQVRRAIEFARTNVAAPITIADMAAAADVSVRALQINFRRFYNETPMAYLRRLRLEGARSDIRNAPPQATIADIAGRWGFTHLGRFSVQYKEAFGVSPSSDLKRECRR
ncbi:helix-turn-helix transcriptional regulator [Rhizobium sp. ZPR3]|uniref:Helix-turn-helix transcriptional regulator n=2 Tax=unclassified Rhizobium TaxID=2613769 RepID=A0AAU7SQL8_9HYPH